METEGIEGLPIERQNWGKTVAFWKGLVGIHAPLRAQENERHG